MSNKKAKLTPFVFPDTGIEVQVRKVSPLLTMEIAKKFRPPKPPMQEVDYGDGKKVLEPNLAHPDYERDMDDYNMELEQKVRRMMIKLGVVCEVDREAVEELRAFWAEEGLGDLDPDDKVVYISHICIGTDGDMDDLVNAIMRRSQPTPEATAAARESFPG